MKMTKKSILAIVLALVVGLLSVVGWFTLPRSMWFALPKDEVLSVSKQIIKDTSLKGYYYHFGFTIDLEHYAEIVGEEIFLEEDEIDGFISTLNKITYKRVFNARNIKKPFVNEDYQYKIEYESVIVFVGENRLTYYYSQDKQRVIKYYEISDLENAFN